MYVRIICCFALLVFGQVASELSSEHGTVISSHTESDLLPESIDHTPKFLSDFIPTTSLSTRIQERIPSTRSRFLKENYQAVLLFSFQPTPSIRTYIPGIVLILPGLSPVNIAYPFQDFI